MTDAEMESQTRAVDRLTFFSDAVVAIAITLLALELPVPTGNTTAEFWSSVHRNGGHYAAFLISFVAIAAAWSHHHDLFRYARRMDPRLRQLNTAWLLMIILNPFATRLLTSGGHETVTVHALRFGFYALLQVLASVLLLAMLRHLTSRDQAPGIPAPVVTGTVRESTGVLLGFGASIPVLFATTYGWVLWIVMPFLARQMFRLRHGRPPG